MNQTRVIAFAMSGRLVVYTVLRLRFVRKYCVMKIYTVVLPGLASCSRPFQTLKKMLGAPALCSGTCTANAAQVQLVGNTSRGHTCSGMQGFPPSSPCQLLGDSPGTGQMSMCLHDKAALWCSFVELECSDKTPGEGKARLTKYKATLQTLQVSSTDKAVQCLHPWHARNLCAPGCARTG